MITAGPCRFLGPLVFTTLLFTFFPIPVNGELARVRIPSSQTTSNSPPEITLIDWSHVQFAQSRAEEEYGTSTPNLEERLQTELEEKEFFLDLLTASTDYRGVPDVYSNLVDDWEKIRTIPTLYSSHGAFEIFSESPGLTAVRYKEEVGWTRRNDSQVASAVLQGFSLFGMEFEDEAMARVAGETISNAWFDGVGKEAKEMGIDRFTLSVRGGRIDSDAEVWRIGRTDSSDNMGQMVFFPLERHSLWQIDTVAVHVLGNHSDPNRPPPFFLSAIVDPTVPLILLPLEDALQIFSSIPTATKITDRTGYFQFPCSDTLELQVSLHGIEITLDSEALSLGRVKPESEMCVASVVGSDGLQGRVILGQPFLKSIETVIDISGETIGIGPLN